MTGVKILILPDDNGTQFIRLYRPLVYYIFRLMRNETVSMEGSQFQTWFDKFEDDKEGLQKIV